MKYERENKSRLIKVEKKTDSKRLKSVKSIKEIGERSVSVYQKTLSFGKDSQFFSR